MARERIYIVFHWAGLLFGFIVLIVFGSGYLLRDAGNLTQTLGITLIVAGVVALIQSNDNLRGIEITGCRAQPAAAGETLRLEVTLRNTSDRERIGLTVRTGWRVRPRGSAWIPVLEAGETVTVHLPLPVKRRGCFPIPPLWVCSVRPVGLCFAWKVFPQTGVYYVYPRPRGRSLDRETKPDRHGGGDRDDVTGHRSYNPGDMLSRLDWRVFARTGKLVVRTLEEGSDEEVVLRWEDTRFLPDVERRLEQLSFWIDQCVKEGRPFRIDLGTGGGLLGSANLAACREALATFTEPP
jgi:Uncharacterized conserved protein (some members contain a von Willebrand factor type A (vWA) domain)